MAIINGTSGADNLDGTVNSDEINGLGGWDTIFGGAGDDEITGGSGNDSLIGGSGDDTFYISGNDFGFDKYLGGDGYDEVRLSSDITVSRFTLNSTNIASLEQLAFNFSDISGTVGNDIFNIRGVTAISGYRTFQMGDGNDKFLGYGGADYVNGGTGIDTLDGGAGDDEITGGSGNDSLIGGSGDDTFYISGNDFGFDKYLGGDGYDEVRLSSDITVSRFTLNSTNIASLEQLAFNFSDISGTGGNDVFHIGGITAVSGYRTFNLLGGNDSFTGYSGADYVNGGGGNDTLDGGAGDDELAGGAGNDIYFVNSSNDEVIEVAGEGVDHIRSIASSYTLSSNVENLTLLGTGNSRGTGNGMNNTITGNNNGNVINGASGNDTLIGRAGNDTYLVNSSADKIIEAASNGIDQVQSWASSFALSANVEKLTLMGESGLTAYGNTANNSLTGNSGANLINGGGGDDTLKGEGGADRLFGGAGADMFVFSRLSDSGAPAASRDIIADFNHSANDVINLSAIDANGLAAGNQAFIYRGNANFTKHAGELRYADSGANVIVSGDTNGDGLADFSIKVNNVVSLLSDDFLF